MVSSLGGMAGEGTPGLAQRESLGNIEAVTDSATHHSQAIHYRGRRIVFHRSRLSAVRPFGRFTVTMLVMALVAGGCGEAAAPETVASIAIQSPATEVGSAEVVTLSAVVTGSRGSVLTGRTITWSSSDRSVAAISTTGIVTTARNIGAAAAAVTISASTEGATAQLPLRVRPVPVTAITVSAVTSLVRVGGAQPVVATLVDETGAQLIGRTIAWASSAPEIATVADDGTVRGIAPGRVTIRATAESRSGSIDLIVAPASGLAVIDISPTQLQPGASVTLTGVGFGAEPTAQRVVIGGVDAQVLSVNATQLVVRAPCTLSGAAPVRVIRGTDSASAPTVTMTVPRRTLDVGQSVVLLSSTDAACSELPSAGGAARYAVVVYSASTSANTLIDVTLSGNPTGGSAVSAIRALSVPVVDPEVDPAIRVHTAHLERERALFRELQGANAFAAPSSARGRPSQSALPVPGEIRRMFYNFGGCRDTSVRITARAVRVGTRAIIWEDSANTLQSSAVPALQAAYNKLGAVFDRDQFETVRGTYGDPLLRDAETDRDGRLSMVFTQKLNGSGAAAYVTSCDQAVRSATAPASNEGEYFYGNVPTVATPNVNSTTAPDGWYAFMVRTVVHEVKHISSQVARVVNRAASLEQSWLEEGTARHAEEVWARDSLHRVSWRGNTGWGDASSTGVFCDFKLSDPTCLARDTLRRPAWGMRRQLNEIRSKLLQPWNWSPYADGTGQSGSVFYNTTWSLVRYTIDRYGRSDADFLGGLNRSTATGIDNLVQVSGVPMDRLLGEWGLALYVDDWPGLSADQTIGFRTWNLRSIYAGLSNDPDWRSTYTTPYPVQPVHLPFGSFTSTRTGVRGGAHAYFELTGRQTLPQVLSVTGLNGAPPSAFTRVAIMRLP
jgi:hypothetical protein